MTESASLRALFQDETLYRDWDYFASAARALRIYLFEYHTIPTWNFLLCGGRPELVNPQSWVYSWPSLLVYLVDGNAVFMLLWLLMTIIGFGAMFLFLRQLGGGRVGAAAGALLYCANGYFASRFNQGQVTFAFYHLVPSLLLLTLRVYEAVRQGKKAGPSLGLLILVSFLFFSAALPHALFYFYPAVLLFIPLLAWRDRVSSSIEGRRSILWVISAHALGPLLASYRLWPMIQWQLDHPRKGILNENLSLVDLLANTLRYFPDYHEMFDFNFPAQVWFAWEYNAYVGQGVWLAIALALLLWVSKRAPQGTKRPERAGLMLMLPLFGLVCCLAGLLLALGNANPFSPAALFHYVPLLSGVRVFGRYQILLIFGLSLLVCRSVDILFAALHKGRLLRYGWLTALLLILFVNTLSLIQTVALVSTVEYVNDADHVKTYPLSSRQEPPRLVDQEDIMKHGHTHQNHLLRQGYWVGNCYEPMTVSHPPPHSEPIRPLTEPAPNAIVKLTSDSLQLAYGSEVRGRVAINLAVDSSFEFNVPVAEGADGRLSFAAEDLDHGVLAMRRPLRGEWYGSLLSALGLMLSLGLVRRSSSGHLNR